MLNMGHATASFPTFLAFIGFLGSLNFLKLHVLCGSAESFSAFSAPPRFFITPNCPLENKFCTVAEGPVVSLSRGQMAGVINKIWVTLKLLWTLSHVSPLMLSEG